MNILDSVDAEMNESLCFKMSLSNPWDDDDMSEGIWIEALNQADYDAIMDDSNTGNPYLVIVRNAALTYPLTSGEIIPILTQGSNRPILNAEPFREAVLKIHNVDIADIKE